MITRLTSDPLAPLRARRNSSKFIRSAVGKTLPALDGPPIRVLFRPKLSIAGRRLYSNIASGQPVHAATFIRRREIVLDGELRERPRELARILTHEVFHFTWARAGNKLRRSFDALLRAEWERKARGELGWSAEWRKLALQSPDSRAGHRAAWRDYVCESFCDTAAWLYSGTRKHEEYTLALRNRTCRAAWFQAAFPDGRIPI